MTVPGTGGLIEALRFCADTRWLVSEKVRRDRVVRLSRAVFNKVMDVNVVTPDHASSSFSARVTWPAGDVVGASLDAERAAALTFAYIDTAGKGQGDTREDAVNMAIEELRLALSEYIQGTQSAFHRTRRRIMPDA